jgi:hypothetical protein
MGRGLAEMPALCYFMDMEDKRLYEAAKKIAQMAAREYDPMQRVEVRGPFEGIVSFPDGQYYTFSDGKAMIHRKNLSQAINMGCRRVVKPSPRD